MAHNLEFDNVRQRIRELYIPGMCPRTDGPKVIFPMGAGDEETREVI